MPEDIVRNLISPEFGKPSEIASKEDYAALFGTDLGKRVLMDLCKNVHLFDVKTNVIHDEVLVNVGERRVVTSIIQHVYQTPKKMADFSITTAEHILNHGRR